MYKKLLISLAVASITTYLVYIGLIDSLTRSSVNYTSISNDTAISLIVKQDNLTSEHIDKVLSKYVYVKGNGEIYDSKKDTNFIGNYIGKTSPTVTTGNHFGWEIYFPIINKTYYIDHLTGETISKK
ncbi:MAG TPA: hypothetical protein VFM28_10905 [Nitrososphaeraceae archaeon]|nr:hypothetical protein [Nitrososphaeraceae archaeon]